MRIFPFHLSDHVSGICGQRAEEDKNNNRTVNEVSFDYFRPILKRGQAYGTNPRPATAAGSDRTPRETVSATMTG